MAKKATRIKTDTHAVRLQSRDDVELAIKQIGDLQRQLEQTAIEQNNELAAITEKYAQHSPHLKSKLNLYNKRCKHGAKADVMSLRKTAKPKQAYLTQAKCNGDNAHRV